MGKNSSWAIPVQLGDFERRLAEMTANLEKAMGSAGHSLTPTIQTVFQALVNTGAGATADMIQEPQPAALSHAERLRNVSDKLDRTEAQMGANNSEWVLTNNQLNRVLSQAQAAVPAEPKPVWICHVTGQQVEASRVKRMEGAGPESPGLYYLPMYGWAVAFPAGPGPEWIRATALRHYEMADRQIRPVPSGMAWNPWHLRPSAQRDADTVAIHCLEFRGQDAILITHFNGVGMPGLPDDSGLFHTRLLKAQVGNRRPTTDTDMEPLLYVLLRARTWAQAVVGHAFTLSELKNEAAPDGNKQAQIPQHNFPEEPPF